MQQIKQLTTANVLFYMVDATDGYSPELAAVVSTPTVYLTKNGAAPAVPSALDWATLDDTNTPGLYRLGLSTTDTSTVGPLGVHITRTGCRNWASVAQINAAHIDDIRVDTIAIRSSTSGITISTTAIAQIASSTWDVAMADHVSTLTVGAKLNAVSAAADPWGVNPTTYNTLSTTFGYVIARITQGTAMGSTTINVQDADDSVIEGVRVDIWKTAATTDKNNFVTTGNTDVNGNVTFYLPAGSYFIYRYKQNQNFTDPISLTVT